MEEVYTHKKKLKLVCRIQKIKKKEDLVKIFSIINDENSSYMENSNGTFMFFHKLKDETYYKIEKELNRLSNKGCTTDSISATSDGYSDSKFKPYVEDEFSTQNNIGPKLKFSNKEKSLIKRKRYDKNINTEDDSDVVYTSFEINNTSDSDKNNKSNKSKEKTEVNTNVSKSKA
jgi:hypothetical protein